MDLFGNQSKSYLEAILKNIAVGPKAFSYEKIVIDGTVKKLTIPEGATLAKITAESDAGLNTAGIRYSIVATPTATNGMPLSNLDSIVVDETENLINFSATQAIAGVHALNVTYYK